MNSYKKIKNIPFGLHLMFDAYGCSKEALNSQQIVQNALNELPEIIGMKKLIEPVVLFAEGNDKRDPGGWTGFVVIQESHISIHTFVKRRFVTADVYSCKEFDPQIAIDYLKKIFRPDESDIKVEVRGEHYPLENIE